MDTDMRKFAADADNPAFPEPIRARLRVVAETATKNLEAINAGRRKVFDSVKRDGNALLRSPKSKVEKVYAIWALADRFYASTGKNVACKRGCSHCCHVAVAVTVPEAEAIGKRIGRIPRKVPLRMDAKIGVESGYHNPCTFLRNGECSIYANRPLACRIQYSLDVDALLCELGPIPSPVPYMNPLDMNMLLLKALEPTSPDCVADIREFFPPKK
ncbi:YkgJ family cysteine cluster protein [Burkholderia pseudomallei]|uniref:YkgJ family cysteine cluster protein n=1 Tax=Burkholderia pseudomallei TaxID=28450 RepID=UPI001F354139|nr:YkgJ family cysteine cluster protein [Burkholderia pseudomallei]